MINSPTICIARHGHRFDFVYPQWFNTALRRYDPPLSLLGQTQAQELGLKLQHRSIDHIIVSPFLRTIQTGHIIAEMLNLPLQLEAGLGEWHNPHWMSETPCLHPQEELAPFYPLINWEYRSNLTPVYPETQTMVLARMERIIDILMTKFTGNLLLIGHSITVTGITQALLNSKLEIPVDFCSMMEIAKKDNQWQLMTS
ncbi:histidine phosphatase family protein [Geminocystis sp. CENA526]|uniref:histidine phosphatase family protein n=1 Tax=Geminocystis sp. CENA526 TaxID=1355871 RepID=UPI003D6DDE21